MPYLSTDGYARSGADVLVPGRFTYDGLGYLFERDTGAPPPAVFDSGTIAAVLAFVGAEALVDTSTLQGTVTLQGGESYAEDGVVPGLAGLAGLAALAEAQTLATLTVLASTEALAEHGELQGVVILSGDQVLVTEISQLVALARAVFDLDPSLIDFGAG